MVVDWGMAMDAGCIGDLPLDRYIHRYTDKNPRALIEVPPELKNMKKAKGLWLFNGTKIMLKVYC